MSCTANTIAIACILGLVTGGGCWSDPQEQANSPAQQPVVPAESIAEPPVEAAPPEIAFAESGPQRDPDSSGAGGEREHESETQHSDNMRSIADLLLFHPTRFPDGDWDPDGLTIEDAWFDSADGSKLHGWYCPVNNSTGTVFYAHGNAGNLSHRAPAIRRLQERFGWNAFIFDYRGYGRSEGKPTATGAVEDGEAALQWLLTRTGLDAGKIVFLGRSLGCAIVVPLAAEHGGKALILESPFLSLREAAAAHYPQTLVLLAVPDQLRSSDAIERFQGPTLISHGTADAVIPFAQGQRLYELANEPKRFVELPDLDHNDRPPEWYYDRVKEFLANESAP